MDKSEELLSLPVIVTCVAFDAVTLNVDELPAVIEVGLALIVTAGAAGAATTGRPDEQPKIISERKRAGMNGKHILPVKLFC